MAHITKVLRKVKDDLGNMLSEAVIKQTCADVGHQWRDRLLNPVMTIHAFILQILHGNTARSHLPHLVGQLFTASAYCQARARLPLEVFQMLMNRTVQSVVRLSNGMGFWHGHRTLHIDGSSFSMPDTPELQDYFGQHGSQKKGCGFPGGHFLALFDAGTGFILDIIASPWRTHDMNHAHKTHTQLRIGDLLVGDCAFCSFCHLALILGKKCHALFNIHQKQIVDFRSHRRHRCKKNAKGKPSSHWLKRLGKRDQLVKWIKPQQCPKWMSPEVFQALPESIVVRELRRKVRIAGHRTKVITLVTTLLDPEVYPETELAELYKRRWQVEVNLRHLKQTMGMDVLRCKSVDGVIKELLAFAMVYNLVRMVMIQSARRQEVKPDDISFKDALRWLCHAPSGVTLSDLIVLYHRPNRVEPRAIKRRPKPYKLMNKPRDQLRKMLLNQRDTA